MATWEELSTALNQWYEGTPEARTSVQNICISGALKVGFMTTAVNTLGFAGYMVSFIATQFC